ncbi:MAG: TIGR04255 family protein [Gemmatimonadales bacterium]
MSDDPKAPPRFAGSRHLSRAPINEAILDWRISSATGIDPTVLKRLADEVVSEYPHQNEQTAFQADLVVAAKRGGISTSAPPAKYAINGYLAKSADKETLLQFRRDGFTLNRLRPYTSWNQVFPEALRHWRRYRGAIGPQAICVRLAVRFINFLPGIRNGQTLDQYVELVPQIPEGFPTMLEALTLHLVMSDVARDARAAVLVQTQPVPDGEGKIVLDIDAFRVNEGGFAEADVEPTMQALRDLKNDIFFRAVNADLVQREFA